ncbi:MAG: glycosyltransferase family 4 protein, partial [Acidobacteriota bacterium]
GGRTMDIPEHPAIRYAGFVSEEDKWGALAGAELLIMPSELESLSMVTLEAWSMGKPVLVNGRCEVLRGQCRRSNAGLYFTSYDEFREALALLEKEPSLREALGRNGNRYYRDHYRWEVIDAKYDRLLAGLLLEDRARLGNLPIERPKGLFARWSRHAG